MATTLERVFEVFRSPEDGDGAAFFDHVADNVVEGTHPLAGHYGSKSDFRATRLISSGSSYRKVRSSRGTHIGKWRLGGS
jgi:hypothetical protein